MRALLDVSLLIALFDPDHTFHDRAHAWWKTNLKKGWASCPITENGVVRIMSNAAYSRKARFTPEDLITRLQAFAAQTNHQFWHDDVSLRERAVFNVSNLFASRQITDVYLLALAAKHHGRLVTFDEHVSLLTLQSVQPENLCVV